MSSLLLYILNSKQSSCRLDDERLEPLFAKLAEKKLMIFLHPHYGITPSLFGERDNGHVLPLALGFPFETTIVSFKL